MLVEEGIHWQPGFVPVRVVRMLWRLLHAHGVPPQPGP